MQLLDINTDLRNKATEVELFIQENYNTIIGRFFKIRKIAAETYALYHEKSVKDMDDIYESDDIKDIKITYSHIVFIYSRHNYDEGTKSGSLKLPIEWFMDITTDEILTEKWTKEQENRVELVNKKQEFIEKQQLKNLLKKYPTV